MENVIYRKEGHIAYISLNRPESRNAINRQLVVELRDVWIDFRDDDDLWVGILSGEGKSFCAGADVKEQERGKWKFRQSLIFGDDRLLASNYGVYKPIVGAVQKHAAGAGMFLALECDVVIASEDLKFFLPEARVNIPTLTAPFITDYMPRAIATEMLYTGNTLSAQRAYDLGMVNKVVPTELLMETAEEYANKILENGPLANWAAKELMYRGKDMDLNSQIALLEHVITPIWNSEDSKEAKLAFVEKRKPVWKLK